MSLALTCTTVSINDSLAEVRRILPLVYLVVYNVRRRRCVGSKGDQAPPDLFMARIETKCQAALSKQTGRYCPPEHRST